MRTVRLLIAFQGTHYEGWQSQKSGRALQDLFEKHLARILKEKVSVISSSRTDSGVHARGLVAHFRTRSKLPDDKIQDALNFYLPPDVVVRSAKTAASRFHARFDARGKTYEYLLWNDRVRPAYDLAPYCLWYPSKLSLPKMRRAARCLLGRHDFSAFRDSGGDKEQNPVRRLDSILISKQGPQIRIRVKGNGFLRHMIRVLVGSLLEVGRSKLSIKDIESALASRDRRKSGPTAKAHGLTLLEVSY